MIYLGPIEGFYWVVRARGYAAAARAFPYPITQPGIYRQVRVLEQALGFALVEPARGKRVLPTAAGRALFAAVAPLIESLPGLVESLRTGSFAGELRLRASNLALRHLVPDWIARLATRHPRLRVTVGELPRADLGPLRRGEADALVDHFPATAPDVELSQVAEIRAFLVLPADQRGRPRLQPKRSPFIAYSSDQAPQALQRSALAHLGFSGATLLTAHSAETILDLVRRGLGFSIVPSLEPRGPRQPGIVSRPLRLPGNAFPLHVASLKTRHPNPLVAALLQATASHR